MVTFEQLLRQAKVDLSSGGLYLAKEHRNCEAMSRVFVAVRACIDGHADELQKLHKEIASVAKEKSNLAATLAEREREISKAKEAAIRIGLEYSDLPEATRDRLLSVNGS
jgi:septal ring factor EnvC (AmiA/AmiB activator)